MNKQSFVVKKTFGHFKVLEDFPLNG